MTQKTVNVLLVEDDEIDVMAVKRAFRKLKIANPLIVAHDGAEALAILRGEGKESAPRPRLLLVDLNMPGMGGIEFIRELRNDRDLNDTIVFVLTSSKLDRDRVDAYNLNVAGYIVKTNVGQDFLELVSMLDHYWRVVEFPT